MGIYTDYGRFMKAREFKNWCNSGAGIWFGFGMGSPRWDYEVLLPDGTRSKPNVPTSSPAAYTPLYRWFATYKDSDWDGSVDVLAQQEYTFIDGSAIIETEEAPATPPTLKTNSELFDDALTFPPDDNVLSPSLNFLDTPSAIVSDPWQDSFKETPDPEYPSPSIPVFPQSYYNDWEGHLSDYDGTNPSIPTDPTQYSKYSYNKHFYDVEGRNVPMGFLSFIQGKAVFVEPIEGEDLNNSLKTFKYGAHYWRIVPEEEISATHLPHHILLTVNVFPNELILDSIAERYLLVRQVAVFKFPDYLESDLHLDLSPLPRSNQVIRAKDINFKYLGGSDESGKINIPFNCYDVLDPNNTDNPTAEMLINDFMSGRKRDVQQTDRYGYIIGF